MKELFREKLIMSSDEGNKVEVKKIMELIQGNQFEKELIELFNLESRLEELVEIQGAREIVELVLNYDKRYFKKDVTIGINDVDIIKVYDNGLFEMEIQNSEEKVRVNLLRDAQNEYFNIFMASSYFDYLHRNGKNNVIIENWKLIKENFGQDNKILKRFRLITDNKKNYVRAIISTNRYFNYDIKFSVFLALLVIHEECKKDTIKFRVDSIDLTDSQVKVRFIRFDISESKETNYKFMVEVSNDEIKKKALHFTGIRKVNIISEELKREFIIESQSSKYNFINVSHNVLPDKVLDAIKGIEKMSKIENDLENEWNQLLKIENPNQLRFLLFDKIEKAKNQDIKNYKKEIKKMNSSINHIYDLLKIMGKIDMLIEESDIGAKLYIHYLFDEILFNR